MAATYALIPVRPLRVTGDQYSGSRAAEEGDERE